MDISLYVIYLLFFHVSQQTILHLDIRECLYAFADGAYSSDVYDEYTYTI